MNNPLSSLVAHKGLITQLARRDVLERYKGSMFGLLWSFFNPLLLLLVYFFVFSIVFEMRWQGAKDHVQFGTVMFAGLIIHSFLGECLTRAPGLIINNTQFVKKVVFPLEVLPVVLIITSLFHFMVGLLVLIIAHLMGSHELNWEIIYLPVILFPFALFALGLSYFLCSMTVFIRDIAQVMGLLTTVLLFLSPVFYPIESVPELVRPIMYLNPLTVPIIELRNAVIWGNPLNWGSLLLYTLMSVLMFTAGWLWFKRTRKVFADVL